MYLNLPVLLEQGFIKRFELGVHHRQGRQVYKMGGAGQIFAKAGAQGIHRFGAGKVRVKGNNAAGELLH